ncbi:MAG: dihydroorotate dehydrogenase-like protein [Leptospiraceae bacterium]|nr:dihydroorotate dehydrogenase-like protein [Leptospiraceae bacterium]
MNLKTKYLGFELKNPLVASSSPLSYELDDMKRMEDEGISAIVLYSLFEEQLIQQRFELHHHLTYGTHSYAEALTYFPEPENFETGPDGYLEHIRKAKESLSVPIIASINGNTPGSWTEFAKLIQEAGADAVELNIYNVPTDMYMSSSQVEESYLEILREVKASVTIPVALKLSPFFTNIAYMARKFDDLGANALVLFNRFYQPDLDLEHLEVKPHILLSTPHDLRLPLRWVALLYGKVSADLALTSGVHKSTDVLKAMMAGAKVAMLCSVLLREGTKVISTILHGIEQWMEEHEYESIQQMQGSMSQMNCEHPQEYERAQYMKALHSVHVVHH